MFSLSLEMSRLTRDGTAEPISRDQIFSRVNADREIFIFPIQLTTSRIGNLTRLIHTLAICDDHTYSTAVQYRPYHKKLKSVLSFSLFFCFREKAGNLLTIPIQIHQTRGTKLGSSLIFQKSQPDFLTTRVSYKRAVAVVSSVSYKYCTILEIVP